ncbi:TetR family transcriptional regulator C-terminal domain-containing protein [Aquimarina algicola]|uniref:TetR/AcrR family transcriptional regulator n=1 Tax=Aquimarina algicola TaxID=2589995 RepID=A0A504JA77_9FLAO|nr:TetR family transcriptional regulator C-terminal domain-containing protein [Aquimarina algicola]TPN85432.1 TetR/AcrR family transcriptional regulator [Aquimarina algicola]
MASPKSKQIIDSNYIIAKYMDYVLDHDGFPKSVYKFCKDIKIKESDFYNFFGSLEAIDKGIWSAFYNNAIDVMSKNKEYDDFSSREKMLTFFYTFFELLTLNRSYVLFTLNRHKMPMENMKQLRGLRKHIKDFATELIETDNDEKMFKVTKNPVAIYSEGAWFQFLFLLKFWKDDESAGFEKTDVAIEKSVNTIFDVFDNTPLNNVLDFGKFLWKEKVM